MKKPGSRGYVLILVSFIVPVMMMATKYVLDVSVEKAVKSGTITKRCAREAALEVARHWNPALTFKQQKEAMYYIADQVYNSSPAYNSANSKYDAIPGLELPTKSSILSRGEFTPLIVKLSNFVGMSPSAKTIKYKEAKTNVNQYTISGYFDDGNSSQSGNEYYAPTIAVAYNELYNRLKSNRNPYSANDDLYINHAYYSDSSSYKDANNFSYNVVASNLQGLSTYSSQSTIGEQPYLTRENPNDTTVAVLVNDDQIQVVADDSVASAVPAECNVDIVLSIPVNSAACNEYATDENTGIEPNQNFSNPERVGKPYISTSKTIDSSTTSTPIYQIAQAYRAFLKENFFYTRGVNVGLIPYSGKITLPSDKIYWTRETRAFNEEIFIGNQNTKQAMLIGAMLYGSNGIKGGDLETLSKIPNSSCGTGIMCRGADVNYNGMAINGGDILSNIAPSDKDDSTKFQKMYIQPCYGGYANFLSMSCEADCIAHKINPFAILELTPDVQLIYEMLNVFHPYYDDKNNSNFVFLPVTWANNLFQSWTSNAECDSVNTLEDTTNYGRLSCPSKTTLERKKVLILIVNKPDWFEHEELTYLGFDNDFSEIPMFESDCIRGDIDYSDTSKKFADGTSYNRTIQGAKKILKLTSTTDTTLVRNSNSGYYECSSGTAKLSFPKKYLVKIVVEPGSGGKKAVQQTTYNGPARVTDLCFFNDYFYARSYDQGLFRSKDCINWECLGMTEYFRSNAYPCRLCYSNTAKVFLTIESRNVYRGADVMSMSSVASSINAYNLAGHDNIFIACSRQGNIYISTDAGKTWTDKGKKFSPISITGVHDFIYGNGKFIAFSDDEEPFISEDNGETWKRGYGLFDALNSYDHLGVFNSSAYGNGMFIAVNYHGGYIAYSNDGINWARYSTEGTHISKGATFGLNSFWIADWGSGKFFKLLGTNSEENIGIIKFSDISPQTNVTTNDQYQIKERREFYIEPHQITAGSDGNYSINMEMENIRLISAEITNRPYKKVIPSCSLSGTTEGTGTAYITTNNTRDMLLSIQHSVDVTFSNINGSNITNNGKTHELYDTTTFSFPATCFSNNYQDAKVKYVVTNATITNATVSQQTIRKNKEYNDMINVSGDFYGEDIICRPGKSATITVPNISSGKVSMEIHRWVDCDSGHPNSVPFEVKCNDVLMAKLNHANNGRNSFSSYNGSTIKCLNQSNCSWCTTAYSIVFEVSGKNDIKLLFSSVNESAKSGADNFIRILSVMNKSDISLSESSIDNSVWLSNNCINFNGTGILNITVKPTKNTEEIILISSKTHNYVKQSDGTYLISLDITDSKITDLKFTDTSHIFEFTKPTLPQRSRVVDYYANKNSKPLYDESLIAYGENETGKIADRSITWNSQLNCWTTHSILNGYEEKHGVSGWHHYYKKGITGDFYLLINDIGSAPAKFMLFNKYNACYSDDAHLYNNVCFNITGLTRQFLSTTNQEATNSYIRFDICNINDGAKFEFISAGLTLPLNAMLYNDNWYAENNFNATDAIKNVTKAAIQKLKDDYGDNLRIYLIKYRQQQKYKHPVTGNLIDFDYNYLDSVAGPYIFKASDEKKLKETLDAIAIDIKDWAGYTKAHVVGEEIKE